MSRLDDLEASLFDADGWNRDQLAVYADELQTRGDPRGELIALDLHAEQTPELAVRRRELLGPLADVPAIRCRYGFVELELDDTANVEVIAKLGRFARYLRGVRIIAGAEPVAAAIAALAITPRPWLASLAIRQSWPGAAPTVSSKAMAAVALIAPRLAAVEVRGHGVLASLAHPAVRVLHITGIDAVLSLTNESELLPSVVELDLAVHGDSMRTDTAWARYLPPVQFPALRWLDLSRNPPLDPEFDPFRFVRQAPIATQLTGLRLPHLATPGDRVNAQVALDRMPDLAVLELSSASAELAHPRATIRVLPARPWRPLTRTQTTFHPGVPIRVLFSEAVAWLDDYYDRMPDDARAAWGYLWDVLLRQRRGAERAVFAERLACALDACGGRVWPELHRALHAMDHGPGLMIAVG